jgi:UDP-N-acetylglucosamine 1-carboxyvinyltransferase
MARLYRLALLSKLLITVPNLNKGPNMQEFLIPNYLIINGGKPAFGHIRISGAKNEVMGAMAAAILTDQPVELRNVPYISDVIDLANIMISLGVEIEYLPNERIMRLRAKTITGNVFPDEALKIRTSYYLWGPLLARFKITKEFDSLQVHTPGGCKFGANGRSADFTFNLMQNIFNIETERISDTKYKFTLPKEENSTDKHPVYATKLISHGTTFNWLLSTALMPSVKFIYNAAQEPEVPHLLAMLNKMGAAFRGTRTTAIASMGHASGKLLNGGSFEIMPDRMEAGSYALLALATRGKITLSGIDPKSFRPWLNSLKEIAGAKVVVENNVLNLDFTKAKLQGEKFIMSPFPGKETDLQQIWTAALTTADSESLIVDPIYPTRGGHVAEMEKFNASIDFRQVEIENFIVMAGLDKPLASVAKIQPSEIKPAIASGMDLRGTFGLIVLAAAAKGQSRIETPSYAFRGYPNLIENLKAIGIDVTSC